MKKSSRRTTKIFYPRFDTWAKKKLKNPLVRAAYEQECVLINLAFALEDARQQKHLTQEQLAHTVGMKPEAISRLESGTHNMTVETLVRVAAALGKHVELR